MARYKGTISNLPIVRVKDYTFDDEDPELVKKAIDLYYGAIREKMSDPEDFKTISLLYLGSLRPNHGMAKHLLSFDTLSEENRKKLENVLKHPNKFKGYKSTLYADPPDGSDE